MIDLVVVGASGAGRRVVDIVQDCNDEHRRYRLIGVLDDNISDANMEQLRRMNVAHLGGVRDWLDRSPRCHFVVGIGDSATRSFIDRAMTEAGHSAASIVHPAAHVSRHAVIGAGTVISPNVEISTNVTLGRHVHITANAAISHDCVLADFVNVNPGAVLAGNVMVGAGATVGAGAVVRQGLSVGEGATVGAAACVVRDVPRDAVVVGVPARPLGVAGR